MVPTVSPRHKVALLAQSAKTRMVFFRKQGSAVIRVLPGLAYVVVPQKGDFRSRVECRGKASQICPWIFYLPLLACKCAVRSLLILIV